MNTGVAVSASSWEKVPESANSSYFSRFRNSVAGFYGSVKEYCINNTGEACGIGGGTIAGIILVVAISKNNKKKREAIAQLEELRKGYVDAGLLGGDEGLGCKREDLEILVKSKTADREAQRLRNEATEAAQHERDAAAADAQRLRNEAKAEVLTEAETIETTWRNGIKVVFVQYIKGLSGSDFENLSNVALRAKIVEAIKSEKVVTAGESEGLEQEQLINLAHRRLVAYRSRKYEGFVSWTKYCDIRYNDESLRANASL
jgi:hypothetical protein